MTTDAAGTDAAIVVDASVAAKWLLRDESSVAEADKLLDRYDAGALDLLAPQQIEIEVANAIRKAVLNGRVSTQAGNRHLEEWLGPVCARFRLIPNGWLLPQAFSCSLALSVTLFDALYIVLAEELGLELVVADTHLLRATAGVLDFVHLLGDR